MSKTKSISVPPSTVHRVEGLYKPQNTALFKVYQQYRKLRDGYSAKDNPGSSQVRLANNAFDPNYEVRMVVQILEHMPVWIDADEDFQRENFSLILDFFRAKHQIQIMEERVIEQILVLREQYEFINGNEVLVTPDNEAVAKIYKFVADSLAKLGFADLNEIPTSPELKVPKKTATM